MIPMGDDGRIRAALRYMAPEKVLQWAQVTICPGINKRDIARLLRDQQRSTNFKAECADKPNYRSRHSTPIGPSENDRCDGSLARAIDRLIAARSKECGVRPEHFKHQVLRWTVSDQFNPRRFAA